MNLTAQKRYREWAAQIDAQQSSGLLWEGDGFLLLYKRLEDGRFKWPRNAGEVRAMSPQQYRWLMEGLDIRQRKYVKDVMPKRAL